MRNAPRAALLAAAMFFLYLYGVGDAGLIGPDEPRYASIGRQMAESGDWITPRLWGDPWFEKPPLEYWGIALAYKLGFGDDTAPRVFNGVLSAAFLAYFWRLLARIYSPETAWTATLILATTAGWAAESRIAVMDLPLAAMFSAAMLTALGGSLAFAGVFLGFAVLAKGLVALVLALPALWFFRRQWKEISAAATACLIVAGPWFVAMVLRHGRPFLVEFVVRQHFSRFTEGTLQHQQPFWFFVPVLLAGLFPWTPALAAVRWRNQPKQVFLWLWLLFGLIFFSLSHNKLPGYVLPLLPPLAILCALALRESRRAALWCAACGAALGITPVIAHALPDALASGISRASLSAPLGFAALIAIGGAGAGIWRGVASVGACAALCLTLIWVRTAKDLDVQATARPTWRAIESRVSEVCIESMHRSWRYGLRFYSQTLIPDCDKQSKAVRIRQQDSEPPEILLESQTGFPGPAANPDRAAF